MGRQVRSLILLFALPLAAQGPGDERVQALVQQLGADSVEEREEASRQLLAIGRPALDALAAAARGDDPERSARAAEILPYIRWGLSENAPTELLTLLGEYETATDEGRSSVLLRLAARREPEAGAALYGAWWDVKDPRIVAGLAMERLGFDSDLAEERLRAMEPEGDPKVLQALAQVRWFRDDPSGAADLFARAAAGGLVAVDPWSRALFDAHRYRELVEAARTWKDLPPAVPFRIVEALFRLGRREDAEDLFRSHLSAQDGELARSFRARDIVLCYGLGRVLLGDEPAEDQGWLPFVVRASIHEGRFDRAEEAWRSLPKEAGREGLLEELLLARGERDLATPAFLAEASEGKADAAALHLRLAVELADTDPDRTRIERRKAALLDPSRVKVIGGPPRPPGGSGFGCWAVPITDVPEDLMFASSPVQVGEFFYYATSKGDLVKTRDPRHPEPTWVYSPQKGPRLNCQGWASGTRLSSPLVARWDGKIAALYTRWACMRSGDTQGSRSGASQSGYVLCVLNEETGREEWTRAFPYFSGARLFPDAGLVTFSQGGLAVFDLERRDWRWSITSSGSGACAAWASGDAVYVGNARGVLAKLRAADGALEWRKAWPVAQAGRCAIEASGERLVYAIAGERLVCLSLADDSVLWETAIPSRDLGDEVLIDADRVVLASTRRGVAAAWRLADGTACWRRRIARGLFSCSWRQMESWICLSAHGGSDGVLVFLDKADGRTLGVWFGRRFLPWESAWFETARGVCVARMDLEHVRMPLRSDEVPTVTWTGALEVSLVHGPAPEEDTVAEAPTTDRMAAISLLEDACAGPSSRDGSAWRALAEACVEVGRSDWAVDPMRKWMLFGDPGLDDVRTMRLRLESAVEEAFRPPVRQLIQEMQAIEDGIESEQAFLKGELPAGKGNDSRIRADLLDLVEEGESALALRRSIALVREGCAEVLPMVASRLVEADDATTLQGIDAIVGLAARYGRQETLFAFLGASVRDAVRVALDQAVRDRAGAVRGAALGALEVLGERQEAEDAEAALRLAMAEGGAMVRLSAIAALARRGAADARKAVLDAIRSADERERRLAIRLAGDLGLEDAVPLLVLEGASPGGHEIQALIAIGTDEAWGKVFTWAEKKGAAHDVIEAMKRSSSPRALAILRSLCRSDDHSVAFQAWNALAEVDSPEARAEAMSFVRLAVRIDPDRIWSMHYLVRAALASGDPGEARTWYDRLASRVSPTSWLAALECDLLVAEGDLDRARASRIAAEGGILRARAIDPDLSALPRSQAELWLSPEAIAEPAKAIPLLEEALRLDPRDSQAAAMLNAARGGVGR